MNKNVLLRWLQQKIALREAATYFSSELVCNRRTPPQCSGPNGPKFVKRSEQNLKKPKLSKLINVFLPNIQSNERYKGWSGVGWGTPKSSKKIFCKGWEGGATQFCLVFRKKQACNFANKKTNFSPF